MKGLLLGLLNNPMNFSFLDILLVMQVLRYLYTGVVAEKIAGIFLNSYLIDLDCLSILFKDG